MIPIGVFVIAFIAPATTVSYRRSTNLIQTYLRSLLHLIFYNSTIL